MLVLVVVVVVVSYFDIHSGTPLLEIVGENG